MTSKLDLLLTLAALASTKTPEDRKMDGHNLSPVLSNEEKPSKYILLVGTNPITCGPIRSSEAAYSATRTDSLRKDGSHGRTRAL